LAILIEVQRNEKSTKKTKSIMYSEQLKFGLRIISKIPLALLKCGMTGLVIWSLFYSSIAFSQQDSLNPKRLQTVIGLETIGYAGAMAGMYALWYKDIPSSSFHTFNDNAEWLQMDKIGHGVTSYYVGKAGYEVLKWSGVSQKKSIWYGGTLGLFFLTSVEVFDGYSSAWGFSWGDVGVNAAGATFFIAQQLAWDEQRVLLKYSFHKSKYATLRPDLLGENLLQNALKDYNGQTYWLSANIKSFLKNENNFPAWLNVAVGYGAENMYGAHNNIWSEQGTIINRLSIKRIRQFYLAPDIDFTKIPVKSRLIKSFLLIANIIKFPAPTVEFNSLGKAKFHFLYF
jgi:uncharacterized protein YfiM (DUF2279 family)